MNELSAELTSHPLFMRFLTLALVCAFLVALTRLAQFAATRGIADKDLRYKTRKGIGLAGYGFALIMAIAIFSDQMTNLAVIIGALSVGIGFALRELIQNLIGWMTISFGNIYKPGDRIRLGGVMGDVMDIGPLVTTVMECGDWVNSDLYNGRVVHLPNNLVLRENVFNYTVDFPFLWDEIVIPVSSDSDRALARTLIESVLAAKTAPAVTAARQAWEGFLLHHRPEEARMAPVVTMSFDANWIEYTLRYPVDYRIRRAFASELFEAALAEFDACGGRVRVATPPLQVRLPDECGTFPASR